MYENHSPEIKIFYICCALKEKQNARMVKLVDTLVSGTSDRKVVQVRVLFRAEKQNARMVKLVDTLVSGTSDRKVVQVRVLFRAPKRMFRQN
jgi:hypothetical protein